MCRPCARAALAYGARLERIEDLRPLAACVHKARLAQHLEVLAHGRLADVEDAREVARAGTALFREAERDPESDRVSECLQLQRLAFHVLHCIARYLYCHLPMEERNELQELMTLQTGDEKHESSATSTLDVLQVLYDRILRYRPDEPEGEGRDRFLLRDGILGAHPDHNHVPGVEVSTGSLGHGLPMAVGVAYALRAKGLDEQRVVVLTGDAELNEGSNWEAILHAGAKQLGNLTLAVVDNKSGTIPMGSIEEKLAAFGWDAETVDGRDHDALESSFRRRGERPTAVVARIAA